MPDSHGPGFLRSLAALPLVGMVAATRGGRASRASDEGSGERPTPKRYHRRATDPEYDPNAPPEYAALGRPHERATDRSVVARIKESSTLVAAIGVLFVAFLKVLEWVGVGTPIGPGSRTAQLDTRIARVESSVGGLVLYRCLNRTAGERMPRTLAVLCAELGVDVTSTPAPPAIVPPVVDTIPRNVP